VRFHVVRAAFIESRIPKSLLVVAELICSIQVCRADHLDVVVAAEMAKRYIPGVAVAVIDQGRVVREQGYGVCDLKSRTPETVFQVASISKPVTAIGALRLVREDKVSLDEEVNKKLRTWKVPENEFTQDHPVTLRLLLSHSAGLTVSGFGNGYPPNAQLPTLTQILDGVKPANSAPIRVASVPGQKWSYSGGGYLVIQQMVIDLTGEPFEKYMEDKVLRALGMNSSTFSQSLPESFKNRAATGYPGLPGPQGGERWRLHPELAAGGLWSSAGDVARLLIAVQKAYVGTDSSILSQKLAHEMLIKQSDDYGLGFFLGGTPLRFGHNGENRGFSAISVAFADTGQGVVFLMNASTDIEVLKNILVEATGEEYHWPGYPNSH
jgi:CubicO group peptidase (beta-lactamase class C family)